MQHLFLLSDEHCTELKRGIGQRLTCFSPSSQPSAMEAFPFHSPKDDYSLLNVLCRQSSLEKNAQFLVHKNAHNLDNINSHASRFCASNSCVPTSTEFRFRQFYATNHFPLPLSGFSNHSSCNVSHGFAPPVLDQTPAEHGSKRKSLDKTKETEMKSSVCGKRSKVSDKRSSSEKHAICTDQPPKDFIHVRARRGQATDSHSLAERVRREKINERMRILRELVPGCTKTGKALILEQIINYVKSLQNQVELLSMKVASLSDFYDFSVEIGKELTKDIKGANHIFEGMENCSEAQPSHVFGLSNMQERAWTSLGAEEIKLKSMGANGWEGEIQYLLD